MEKRNNNNALAHFLAQSHIAGEKLSDGMNVLRLALHSGWMTTLSYWNDPHDTPAKTVQQYLQSLDAIAHVGGACRLSIRPGALGHDFAILKEIVMKAKTMNIPLHFDAETVATATVSFRLFERACGIYEEIGFTLPARWNRSVDDARKIMAMQKSVRIVKGQRTDTASLADHVRRRFLSLAELCAKGKNRVTIATHDKPVAAVALRTLTDAGVQCELEQMFGLPWLTVMEKTIPVPRRMYVPFGTPSLPYNVFFLHERFEILYWMLRDSILRREKKVSLLRLSAGINQVVLGSTESLALSKKNSLTAMGGK